jgi:hypothetical protein
MRVLPSSFLPMRVLPSLGSALAEARNELEVARHVAARQVLELDAARKGIFVGETDGGQDRVASR